MSDTTDSLRDDISKARWRQQLWAKRREEADRNLADAVAAEQRAEAALAAKKVKA